MKIATYNINNVNERFDNLLNWLVEAQPHVVCLEEFKAESQAFPAEALEQFGYRAVWAGQRSWNGVAILARGAEPVLTRRRLPGDPSDTQARYIEAAVDGVLVASLYLPNGNPQPGPKSDDKLAWFERLIGRAADLRAAAIPAVLAGDYNVVPSVADIYQPHRWADDALLQPQVRQAFQSLLAQGWSDALASQPPWTFWAYLRDRWPRDQGLRIDHLLLSPELASRLVAAGVDRGAREEKGASNHAPTWIELDL